MKWIPVDSLYDGLKFSAPIFMDEGIMFVPAGVPIKKSDLKRLASLGIVEVQSDGYPVADEDVDTAETPRPPSAPQADTGQSTPPAASAASGAGQSTPPAASAASGAGQNTPSGATADTGDGKQESTVGTGSQDVYKKLNGLITRLDAIFTEVISFGNNKSNIKSRGSLAVRQLWNITAVLIQIVKACRQETLSFILCGTTKGLDLAKNSLNTAILSMLIAEEMGFKPDRITEITAAALLHDIGMLRLNPFILNKKGRLTQDEVGIIQSHPAISYKIIHQELLYSDEVAVTALQHHERWNGDGYPNGIAGRAISVAARIVCIADTFEAMVSEKPYRNSVTGYQAMKTLVSASAAQFSPDVLQAFVKVMGIYPIGSGVALNDGRIARIIQLSGGAPLRPTVKIIADTGAKRVADGEIIDLLKSKHIFITQPIDLKGF